MIAPFTESDEAALEGFGALGYRELAGPDIAPGSAVCTDERSSSPGQQITAAQ